MQLGVIVNFGAKGYGFIEPADEGPRVFFHVKNCYLRDTYLEIGDHVEFEINQFASSGRQRVACEVRVIPNSARKSARGDLLRSVRQLRQNRRSA